MRVLPSLAAVVAVLTIISQPAVVADLAGHGHGVQRVGDFSEIMGSGQAVMRDARTGVNYGASDPRAAMARINGVTHTGLKDWIGQAL